jgi:hypothetical protein
MSNVIFSVGAYGRIDGHLPSDSPYAHPHTDDADAVDGRPGTPERSPPRR